MAIRILIFLLSLSCLVKAQEPAKKPLAEKNFSPTSYISFNPLGFAEPQMALGLGYGTWFSRRSEIFAEASYISNSWFYNDAIPDLKGIRIIAQYKYHRSNIERKSFVGVDLRWKTLHFSGNADFVNPVSNDTLRNHLFKANSNTPGAGIILGRRFKLSPQGKWQGDLTFGIGARQKYVRYKNIEKGYQRIFYGDGWARNFPKIDEEVASPYFPFAFRIFYKIN